MAVPPEPLDELLSRADTVVVAEVESYWDAPRGGWSTAAPQGAPAPDAAIGDVLRPIGAAPPRPAQRLKLRVSRTLRGIQADEIEVDKPAGDYLLLPGHHGAFLLASATDRPVILGRYGPDTFPVAEIEDALAVPPDNPD